MKKLVFLVTLFTLFATAVNAENYFGYDSDGHIITRDYRKSRAKYEGTVEAGHSFGIRNMPEERINVHTVHSARFGKYFSAGIGLGADYFFNAEIKSMYIHEFINVKGYLPVSRFFVPFVSFDFGYSQDISELVEDSGIIISPSIGIQTGIFKVQAGYLVQNIYDEFYDAIQLKLGIVF